MSQVIAFCHIEELPRTLLAWSVPAAAPRLAALLSVAVVCCHCLTSCLLGSWPTAHRTLRTSARALPRGRPARSAPPATLPGLPATSSAMPWAAASSSPSPTRQHAPADLWCGRDVDYLLARGLPLNVLGWQ